MRETVLDLNLLNKIISGCRGSKAIVILDIDGTLLNPIPTWRNWINNEIGMTVTTDDIEEVGNVTNFFKRINRLEEAQDKINQLIHSRELNRDFPYIDCALRGVNKLSQFSSLGLACYLTSRPDVILDITRKDLAEKGFPKLPIVIRSDNIPQNESTAWKIANINYINARYQSNVIMIDDSLELGLEIQKQNEVSENSIVSIVLNGPLTHVEVEKKAIISNPQMNFYIAKWDTIPEIAYQYIRNDFQDT